MLRRISSNKTSFRPISFDPGVNIILADRAEDASSTDSRNARGKTTLLLLLSYLLGGNLPTQLRPLQGQGWVFNLTLDLAGHEVTATRSIDAGTVLTLAYPTEASKLVEPYLTEGTIRVNDWKELLGLALFRLDEPSVAGDHGISVRTLLSYVVRLAPGRDPLKVVPQQPAWSSRQHVAFMLGLDWARVRTLQTIARKLDALKAVTTASQEGLLPALGNESELLILRSELQRQLMDYQSRIDNFQVLDDPNGMVERADGLTAQISALRDEALVDQRMTTLYGEALEEAGAEAQDALGDEVAAVYEQAGVQLGDLITKRLDEVQSFHRKLSENREMYLQRALAEIEERSEERRSELTRVSSLRESLMRALNSGGALDELLALRDERSEFEGRLAEVDYRLSQVRDLAEGREQLRAERATQRADAQEHLSQNRVKLDRIAERFDARMQRLYGVGGVLTAGVDDSGYQFSIDVAGQSSAGVNKMKLFCLDLTLMEEGVESDHHPDFLVHDSSVFDGVDPRQVAAALNLAHEAVSTVGGQYICTLNSNDLSAEVRGATWFEGSVKRVVLDTDEGGILGVAF